MNVNIWTLSLLSQVQVNKEDFSESSTSSQSSGLPTQHAAHVLEEKKERATKSVVDDEGIRSLTKAEAITADIPEQVTYVASNALRMIRAWTPKKVSCESVCPGGSRRSVKEKSLHARQR